jgi:hypothetical protein
MLRKGLVLVSERGLGFRVRDNQKGFRVQRSENNMCLHLLHMSAMLMM